MALPHEIEFILQCGAEFLSSSPASIRLDAGVLDHLPPFDEFGLHVVSQLLRDAGKTFEAYVLEFRLDFGAVDDLAQCAIELGDDLRRRARRRDEARPSIEIEAFDSGLIHGWHAREQRAALDA